MKPYRRANRPIIVAILAATVPSASLARGTSEQNVLSHELAFTHRQPAYEELPSISADGQWVAYSVMQPAGGNRDARYQPNGTPGSAVGSRIMVQQIGKPGGSVRDICPQGGSCWRPVWAPKGDRLAFYSDADGAPRLWLYELGKATARRVSEVILKPKLWPGDEPAWAPDGSELFVPLAPAGAGSRADRDGLPSDRSGSSIVSILRSGREAIDSVRDAPAAALSKHLVRENKAALAAIGVSSGAVRTIVPADATPVPSVLRLSPSGRWLTYLSVFKEQGIASQQTTMDLGLLPSRGGSISVLASDLPLNKVDYHGLTYRWHPTEDQLVYLKNGKLWLVDVRGDRAAAPRQLAAGLQAIAPSPLLFTREGNAIIVGSRVRDEKDYGLPTPVELAIVPLDGSEPQMLRISDRWEFKEILKADSSTAWQPEPGAVTVLMKERTTGENAVLRLGANNGREHSKLLWKGLARVQGLTGGGRQDFLVGTYQDIATPPALYRFGSDFGTRTRLTTIEPRFSALGGATVEIFETRVPIFDGSTTTVRTAVLLPPGAKRGDKLPAIVLMYPGSDASSGAEQFGGGDRISVPTNIFLSRGYAVIYPHIKLGPDGESGQPAREMTDVLLPQVYRAAELGYVDADRLGIAGQSYGGYGTAAIISRTNLFRAAVAISGIYDLPGTYGHMLENGTSFFIGWTEGGQARMGTHPWANLARYVDNSPYYQADKIKTPLLIVHGNEDMAYHDGQKLFSALRRLGGTAQLASYHGQGHVVNMWDPAHAADATRRMVSFLDRHLDLSRPSEVADQSHKEAHGR